jgi:hypothetical protein
MHCTLVITDARIERCRKTAGHASRLRISAFSTEPWSAFSTHARGLAMPAPG